jgi:signal transduction histidine kinase
VRELGREAQAELRSLILGLRPADLDADGLEGALRKEVEMLSRVHAIEVQLHAQGAGVRVADADRELGVLRIAHEALHNAVSHAAAEHVVVELDGTGPTLKLEVVDDGVGFDPDDSELRSRHLGLTSMEERARELGGTLSLSSARGRGTRVTLEVPQR